MDLKDKLSIVIASGAGGEFLPKCLDSLELQVNDYNAELIVVDRCGGETRERIQKSYPWVKLINAPLDNRPSVPELRAIGVDSAKGEIVAIIEEHCVVPSNWIRTIIDSFTESDAALGGPIIDNKFKRIRDWVVYFSEYHNYLPPWPDGPRFVLNGANIAYNRSKLHEMRDVLKSGYWEVVLHPGLSEKGTFKAVNEMGVYHTGPFDFGYYLRQRYLLSRVWGGTQRESSSMIKRIIYLFAAPIFPLLLFARISHRVIKNKNLIGRYVLATPLLIPVVCAYVWGEWLGYLMGVGNALQEVE